MSEHSGITLLRREIRVLPHLCAFKHLRVIRKNERAPCGGLFRQGARFGFISPAARDEFDAFMQLLNRVRVLVRDAADAENARA